MHCFVISELFKINNFKHSSGMSLYTDAFTSPTMYFIFQNPLFSMLFQAGWCTENIMLFYKQSLWCASSFCLWTNCLPPDPSRLNLTSFEKNYCNPLRFCSWNIYFSPLQIASCSFFSHYLLLGVISKHISSTVSELSSHFYKHHMPSKIRY